MMQNIDPLGLSSYMRSRMRELFGPDLTEAVDIPRVMMRSSEREPFSTSTSYSDLPISSFYMNHPDLEWIVPEVELLQPKVPALTASERARGHRPIQGGGTEILESPNTRPARPPRRLFRVDVTESEDSYFLRADLAGMTKDNVKINTVEDQNVVMITVEPPKDDFFGLYKSPLESQAAMEGSVPIQTEKEREKEKEVPSTSEEGEKQAQQSEPQLQPQQVHPKTSSQHKETCHLIERCIDEMSRSIKMPQAVDMNKVEAFMKEGLLLLKFAKKAREEKVPKQQTVEIK